ncbi:unnamed protein product, partial [Didymodactylos carnosus]
GYICNKCRDVVSKENNRSNAIFEQRDDSIWELSVQNPEDESKLDEFFTEPNGERQKLLPSRVSVESQKSDDDIIELKVYSRETSIDREVYVSSTMTAADLRQIIFGQLNLPYCSQNYGLLRCTSEKIEIISEENLNKTLYELEFKRLSTVVIALYENIKRITPSQDHIRLQIYVQNDPVTSLLKNPLITAGELHSDIVSYLNKAAIKEHTTRLYVHKENTDEEISESMYQKTLKDLGITDQTKIIVKIHNKPRQTHSQITANNNSITPLSVPPIVSKHGVRLNNLFPASPFPFSSVFSTKTLSLSKHAGLRGLINLGNTCFMNSALQCLSNIRPLTIYFLENIQSLNGEMSGAYADFISNIWDHPQDSCFEPKLLKRRISLFAPQFTGYGQHDAQEFMNFLLDALHEDLKRFSSDDPQSIIADLFHGEMQSVVQCSQCSNSEVSTNLFTFLPLHLHQKSRVFDVEYRSLNNGVKSYRVETARNGNISNLINDFIFTYKSSADYQRYQRNLPRANCLLVSDSHQKHGHHSHGELLRNILTSNVFLQETSSIIETCDPKELTIYECLEKFTAQEILGKHGKWYCSRCDILRNATKTFNIVLLPKVLILQLKRFSYNDSNDKINIFVDCPLTDLDLSDFTSNKTKAKYDLAAVSNHSGTLKFGHYVTNAKNFATGKWYQFDDQKVNSIIETDVITKNAYILVYIQQ